MSGNDLDLANARYALREMGNAIERLREALARDANLDSMMLDATIQRFEFCVELTWKVLKKLLQAEGEEAKTPKQALRKAYAVGWIDEEDVWPAMIKDRNLTSHTYQEELARKIYTHIHTYYPELW